MSLAKLTQPQLDTYFRQGFLASIPIFSQEQAQHFQRQLDDSCQHLALLSQSVPEAKIVRLDGCHQFFPWAWALATHPNIISIMKQLLGSNIILKATRFFYKHPHSNSFVGWHQDGFTEKETGNGVPTIWLGLTPSYASNGCLQVLKGSHLKGLFPHPNKPHVDNLTYKGTTAQTKIEHVSNIEMEAGCMSLHHPLTVHGSQANMSNVPRIGFSASFATDELPSSISPVAWVSGSEQARCQASNQLNWIEEPNPCNNFDAATAYVQHLGHRIRWQHHQVKEQM